MRYGFKNAEEVKETSLKYNLHSWSVQGKLNPAVVEKAEGIYYYKSRGILMLRLFLYNRMLKNRHFVVNQVSPPLV